MKKKLLSVLIAFTLVLSCIGLTACGSVSTVESTTIAQESSAERSSSIAETESKESADTSQSEAAESDDSESEVVTDEIADAEVSQIDEDGWYDSKEDVALYIYTYGKLPDNYITKKEAQALGWSGGGLDSYAPGKSIGGSHFGNYEGILPDGHNYTECDIDTAHASSRGAKRIVFSDDGLIYYTDDHYESFELLYGEE